MRFKWQLAAALACAALAAPLAVPAAASAETLSRERAVKALRIDLRRQFGVRLTRARCSRVSRSRLRCRWRGRRFDGTYAGRADIRRRNRHTVVRLSGTRRV